MPAPSCYIPWGSYRTAPAPYTGGRAWFVTEKRRADEGVEPDSPTPHSTPHSTPDVTQHPARRPLAGDPRALLGFFSRLPVGASARLEDVAAAFPLVPLVGWTIGLIAGVVALVAGSILPAAPIAALLLLVVVGLTGFNQTDGLLDLGDGLMVHGDTEKRLRVMHDHSAGVGAVSAVLFTYLLGFAALAGIAAQTGAFADAGWLGAGSRALAAAVVLAEVAARLPYLLLAWLGRPSHGGLGSQFLEGFGARHALVGLAAAAPVVLAGWWLGRLPVVLVAAAALLVAVWLLRTATRLLGGVGGDVLGASQELARTAALLAISVGLAL